MLRLLSQDLSGHDERFNFDVIPGRLQGEPENPSDRAMRSQMDSGFARDVPQPRHHHASSSAAPGFTFSGLSASSVPVNLAVELNGLNTDEVNTRY